MRTTIAAAALALATLALTAGPAAAVPAVQDGFTVTGKAGGRVRVRLTRTVTLRDDPLAQPRLQVRAASGPIAGLAFVAKGNRLAGYVVGTTPVWTCGAATCGRNARLADADPKGLGPAMVPPGEYVLVLVGAPGAFVTVTLPVPGRRRPPVLRATGGALPFVTETADAGTAAPVQPLAAGTFATTPQRVGLLGVVHSIASETGVWVESDRGVGRTGQACTDHRSNTGEGQGSAPMYLTKVAATLAGPGELCGRWIGGLAGGPGRQRGVGFFVPLG